MPRAVITLMGFYALFIIALALVAVVSLVSDGPTPDERFLDAINDGGVAYLHEKTVIDTGHAICETLEADVSLDTLLVHGSLSAQDMRVITDAAIDAYCPEQG